jgi:hypothetical protein
VLRLVMTITVQMQPLVQSGRDVRCPEQQHQRNAERTDEPTKARRGNSRSGDAGDHVRKENDVTIPNSSSRVLIKGEVRSICIGSLKQLLCRSARERAAYTWFQFFTLGDGVEAR